MSYLQRPRLHFAGRFLADVSTVNNDPPHFDNTTFQASYDQLQPQPPQKPPPYYGWWNPGGTGDFALVSCQVTAVCYQDGTSATAASQDPAVGMAVQCVPGKLVDLDTQQQMVSQIFALGVSLVTAGNATVVSADFAVAPFTDIYAPNSTATPPAYPPYSPWLRIPANTSDEAAGAVYQSQLLAPIWYQQAVFASQSRFLNELHAAAGSNPLSIRFNLDAMVMEFNSANFPTGRLVGTIGVAQAGEPRHLTLGRQLFSLGVQNAPPPKQPPLANPVVQYNYGVALVDRNAGKVIVDLGNALPSNVPDPSNPAQDTLIDAGPVAIGYTTESGFTVLDAVPYTGPGWYEQTAGIVDLPAGRRLNANELTALASGQLQLVTFDANNDPVPQAQESADGTYVRADDFVLRMSPGDNATVTLFATQFGQPLGGAAISLSLDNSCVLSQQSSGISVPGPTPGTPNVLSFPPSVTTDARGIAQFTISASDPGTPRNFSNDGGFIDGQVYGIRPLLAGTASAVAPNPSDLISILVWSGYTAPAQPAWNDVQPILQQYANLYPVMKQYFDLSDQTDVTQNAAAIAARLSMSYDNPHYMPVTRDLSPAKAQMILTWLTALAPPAAS